MKAVIFSGSQKEGKNSSQNRESEDIKNAVFV